MQCPAAEPLQPGAAQSAALPPHPAYRRTPPAKPNALSLSSSCAPCRGGPSARPRTRSSSRLSLRAIALARKASASARSARASCVDRHRAPAMRVIRAAMSPSCADVTGQSKHDWVATTRWRAGCGMTGHPPPCQRPCLTWPAGHMPAGDSCRHMLLMTPARTCHIERR